MQIQLWTEFGFVRRREYEMVYVMVGGGWWEKYLT